MEYVATYEDTDSQDMYGVREEKLTFPHYADAAIIEDFATNIIEERSNAITRCEVKNILPEKERRKTSYLIVRPYDFKLLYGYYKINMRYGDRYKKLCDCSDLSRWDTTNAPDTSVTLDDAFYLSGNSSLKLAAGTSSANDYIEYELNEKDLLSPRYEIIRSEIFSFPQELRVWMYFDTIIRYEIILYDTYGANYTVSKMDIVYYALKLSNTQALKIDVGGTNYALKLSSLEGVTVDEWVQMSINISNSGLKNIQKIRFVILGNEPGNVWLDFFDCQINGWESFYMPLKKVKYFIEQNELYADVEFGETVPEIDTKIGEMTRNGGIAYRVFTKQ